MSVKSFKAEVRNAGNLESENKINGSCRSLNKFEPAIQSTKYLDIFDKVDIEPLMPDIPPHPPSSNEERKKRTKNRGQRESTKENENGRDSKLSSRSGEEMQNNKSPGKSHESSSNEKDPEEKIKKAMTRMASKRQKRAERNQLEEVKNTENKQNDPSEKERDSASKTDLRKRKNSNPKLAFEANRPESDTDDEKDAKIQIEKTKPVESKKTKNTKLVSSEYFKSIINGDTLDFTLTPPPQGQLIHGKIICKKGLFNEYFFYLENFKNTELYIMKASRKMTCTKIYYSIDTINYDQNGEASTTEIGCAKVVSNMSRKKFKLDLSNNFVQFKNTEILNVAFKTKPGDPRMMLASASLCQGARNINNDKVTYFLKNKQPVFKMEIKQYVLNYNGRAKRSSKNNFQIIDETSPDDILTQLGKVEECEYHCDFSFPICAVQAFGFALANLCR